MFENLLLAREDATALVTVNRPRVLNALNTSTLDELHRVMQALADDAAVRAVIVTGAGEKAFVAGCMRTKATKPAARWPRASSCAVSRSPSRSGSEPARDGVRPSAKRAATPS